jgi:chromatin remodeling complex protein RSC6
MSSAQTQKVVKTSKTAKKVEEKPAVAAPVEVKKVEEKPVVAEVKSEEVKTEEKKQRVRKPKEDGKPVERKVVTPESVNHDMEELIGFISTALADQEVMKKPSKVLRGVLSRVRQLSSGVARMMKKVTKSTAPKNTNKTTNSGLQKPVAISAQLAKFLGVAADTLHSRVAVTNALCAYIKEKNLQNAANRREIHPDENLINLLDYKGDKTAQPLTYFYLQTLIQPHFIKASPVSA